MQRTGFVGVASLIVTKGLDDGLGRGGSAGSVFVTHGAQLPRGMRNCPDY